MDEAVPPMAVAGLLAKTADDTNDGSKGSHLSRWLWLEIKGLLT